MAKPARQPARTPSGAIRSRALTLILALGAGASWSAVAARADQTRPPPTALEVPTFQGPRPYLVESPDAVASAATPADRAGAAPDTLSARVIVELASPDTDPRGLWPGAEAAPGCPGFGLLVTPSVREAIALVPKLAADPRVARAYVDLRGPRVQRTLPTDPLFGAQWHLRNTTNPPASINADAAWNLGFTGAGVTIGIVDFNAAIEHPDLAPTYLAAASQPLSPAFRDGHSTSCAGLAAAARNTIGGVGVAYDARWSNLTYGSSIADEAAGLAFRNDLNAVKSSSWGPLDNGQTTTLDPLVKAAITSGAQTGRGGLGTVYVWAGGNGGAIDRVDYDPYASSRHVIAINALGDLNQSPSYGERGSCVLASAPSDGNVRAITTTDYNGSNTYTNAFGGTSAAAPIAAGVVALVLQANPALTARDVQHVLIASAGVISPADPDWVMTGSQRAYHERLGFGLIDAGKAVRIAAGFPGVGPEVHAGSGVVSVSTPVPDGSTAGLSRTAIIGESLRVEHVEVTLNVSCAFIGQLRVTLTSPAGTTCTFAEPRFDPGNGYNGYVFTVTKLWDEDAAGVWTLHISDEAAGAPTTWTSFAIDVYGNRRCVADITGIGGPPSPPDDQATVDDIIAMVNAFSDGQPLADIARIGGGIGPDGELTVDDLILFVNTFSDGCP